MAKTQRTAKSWLIILGILWLLFFGAVVVVLVTQGEDVLEALGLETAAEEVAELVEPDEADGWYTEQQASRGGEAYAQHCAECHGVQLEGTTAPALAGDTFWDRWEGDTVHTFFEVTRQTMPLDAPGSLDGQTYADITAYVLQHNTFPPGDSELPPEEDRLQELTIDRAMTVDEPAEPAEPEEAEEPEEPAEPEEVEEPEEPTEPEEAEEPEEPTEPEEPVDTEEPTDVDEPVDAEDEPDVDEPEVAEEPAAPEEPVVPAPIAAVEEDGWFTEAQVQAGESAYAQHCARCHGGDLQGNPPLIGGGFPERYNTVWELHEYTRQTMPLDAPGSLADQTYTDTIAYILHENGYPTGPHRLEPIRARMEEMRLDPELADPPDEPEEPEPDEPEEPEPDEPEEPEAEPEENDNDADANENGNDANEGWFTEEQAERGEQDYSQHCAQCHGQDLQGNPPLIGESFHASFETVWDLFDYTRETMPQGNPGSLDDDTYADITAFVLQQNDFPAGDEELDPDDQDRMQDMPFDPDEANDVEPEEPAEPEEPDAEEPEPDEPVAEEPDPDEPEEREGPEQGRAWLELDTRPANVTINLIGPEGFARRAMGAQTLEDLRPGLYVIAASRGHESAIATVFLESGEIGSVTIVLDEMSRSADVPEEPGLPAAEMPAISRRPGEDVLIGRPMPPIPGMQPAEPDDPDAEADDETDAETEPQPEEQQEQPADDEAEAQTGATAMTVQQAEPRDQAPARDPDDQLQAERGEQAYILHCARCHGATLQGDVAPALAGEVFFERWQGHPVDWLYFQARAGMPPHGPAFLSEQTYADIIVYMLTESGVLEGHEGFGPYDEEFRMLTIAPRPMPDERDQLEAQVDRLREALHEPHDEEMIDVTGPISPIEWPDDLGIAPVGYPGRIDDASAVEGPFGIEEPVDEDEEAEEEENGAENDLEAEEELEEENGEENGEENDLEAEEGLDEEELEENELEDEGEDGAVDDDQDDGEDQLPPSLRFDDED